MRHGHLGGTFSLVSGGIRAGHFGHPSSDGGALVVSAVHTKRTLMLPKAILTSVRSGDHHLALFFILVSNLISKF